MLIALASTIAVLIPLLVFPSIPNFVPRMVVTAVVAGGIAMTLMQILGDSVGLIQSEYMLRWVWGYAMGMAAIAAAVN